MVKRTPRTWYTRRGWIQSALPHIDRSSMHRAHKAADEMLHRNMSIAVILSEVAQELEIRLDVGPHADQVIYVPPHQPLPLNESTAPCREFGAYLSEASLAMAPIRTSRST